MTDRTESERENRRLREIIEAERYKHAWLAAYIQAGGEFTDPLTMTHDRALQLTARQIETKRLYADVRREQHGPDDYNAANADRDAEALEIVLAGAQRQRLQLFVAVDGEQLGNVECPHGIPLAELEKCAECAEAYSEEGPRWRTT